MTRPRILVEGSCHGVVRRTVGRKAFLGPWHPLVRDIVLYALADAQRKTGVELHWAVGMPNHLHLGVTSVERNLDAFMREAIRDISKGLNCLLEATGYEAPGQLWDNDKGHWTRLLTSEAMFERCLYDFGNPMVAGLVERCLESPMLMRSFQLWGGEGDVIKKPPIYFGKDRPSELLVEEVPPGQLFEEAGGDMDALAKALWEVAEDQRRGWAKVRDGRPCLGTEGLRALHPYNEPATPRQRGKRAPEYALGNHPDAPELHRKIRAERKGFDLHYDAGLRNVDEMMPNGTVYEVLVRKRAMAEPDPDALLCGKGLTFAEAKARLVEGQSEDGCLEALIVAATASLTAEREETAAALESQCRSPENREATAPEASTMVREEGLRITQAGGNEVRKGKAPARKRRLKRKGKSKTRRRFKNTRRSKGTPRVESPQASVDIASKPGDDPTSRLSASPMILPLRPKGYREIMEQWHRSEGRSTKSAVKVVDQHAPRSLQRLPADGSDPAPRLVVLRGKRSRDPPG